MAKWAHNGNNPKANNIVWSIQIVALKGVSDFVVLVIMTITFLYFQYSVIYSTWYTTNFVFK